MRLARLICAVTAVLGMVNGQREREIRTPIGAIPTTAMVSCAAIDGTGRVAVVGAQDGTLVLWDCRRNLRITRIETALGTISSVAISDDGQAIAAAGAKGSGLYLAPAWALRRLDPNVQRWPATAVALSRDGQMLAVGGSEGRLMLVHHASGRHTRIPLGDRDQVMALALGPSTSICALLGSGLLVRWQTTPIVRQANALATEPGSWAVLGADGDSYAVRQSTLSHSDVREFASDRPVHRAPGIPLFLASGDGLLVTGGLHPLRVANRLVDAVDGEDIVGLDLMTSRVSWRLIGPPVIGASSSRDGGTVVTWGAARFAKLWYVGSRPRSEERRQGPNGGPPQPGDWVQGTPIGPMVR